MENPFVAPFKTDSSTMYSPLKEEEQNTVELPFEWLDGNPDDENRNGYGVSLEDGKLVIGGKQWASQLALMTMTLRYNGLPSEALWM